MATGLGRTGTAMAIVESISWIFAHQVLDTMPARIQNSIFLKVSLWVVSILNKDSRDIFVLKKYHVLQKFEFENRVWLLNQIQSLADV
jgi:hypothetical protein